MLKGSARSALRSGALAAILSVATLARAVAAAAPDCDLKGADVPHLSALRGQVVYVDFWASWCAPCLLSFPFMNAMHKAYASRGLHIVAVDMDEKPSDERDFLAEHPAAFAVAMGPAPACARSFGVQTMPTSYLIDRHGTIRLVHPGFRPGDAAALKTEIERLLAEAPG